MHADVHHLLHAAHAAELHALAARSPLPGIGPRARLGWFLVETGLRLTHSQAAVRAAVPRPDAFRTA